MSYFYLKYILNLESRAGLERSPLFSFELMNHNSSNLPFY